MHLQFLWLLAFSSSLLARAVPKAGSADSAHSETQRDRDVLCELNTSVNPSPLAFSFMVLQIYWV